MKKKSQPAFSSGRTRFYFLLLFSFFASAGLHAQTVTGKVTDAESKHVADVTVTVKGTGRATVINSPGNFSITATGRETLLFSSVSFIMQESPLKGRTRRSVSIIRGEATIDESVVTAPGIKKEFKKLGYAATSVKADELVTNRTFG